MRNLLPVIISLLTLTGCAVGTGAKDMYIAQKTPGILYAGDSGWCGAPPDTVIIELAQDGTGEKKNSNSRVDIGIGYWDEANPTLQLEFYVLYDDDGVPEFLFLEDAVTIRNDSGPVGRVPLASFDGAFEKLDGTRFPLVPWVQPRSSLAIGEIPEAPPENMVGYFYSDTKYDRESNTSIVVQRWVRLFGKAPINGMTGETIIVDMPPIRFKGETVQLPEARFEKGNAAGRILAINACKANRAGI